MPRFCLCPPPSGSVDGFSSSVNNPLVVPNEALLGPKGIIPLLKKYQFTIEESSSSDVQVALDPELLGRVFENLLAEENDETKEQARKSTGSYYTPRLIVDYMVKDALQEYISNSTHLTEKSIKQLFSDEKRKFSMKDRRAVVDAIDNIKILDPAVGSGAFPMGALQQLLFLLNRVDPENTLYKEKQLEKIKQINYHKSREAATKEIKDLFKRKEDNYIRKLQLIQSCLYGVDIQPIAIQICKLRFFISLIVEQQSQDNNANRGILAMPNLETKFVAADALRSLPISSGQGTFEDDLAAPFIEKLRAIRSQYFNEHDAVRKGVLREEDKKVREEAAKKLVEEGWCSSVGTIDHDIYSQHDSATWFDSAMMFGIDEGYDLIIGNPPYISLQSNNGCLRQKYQDCGYCVHTGRGDIYQLFYEKGVQLLKQNGLLCFITSNKWMKAPYGGKMRKFLIENTASIRLIDLGPNVFGAAAVDTNILLTQKHLGRKSQRMPADILLKRGNRDVHECKFDKKMVAAGEDAWLVLRPMEWSIKKQVDKTGVPLKQWDSIRLFSGIKTGFNELFRLNEQEYKDLPQNLQTETAEIATPAMLGKDLHRMYLAKDPQSYLLCIPRRARETEQEFRAKCPLTYQYLRKRWYEIKGKEPPRSKQWWSIEAMGADQPVKEKLAWPDIIETPCFAIVAGSVCVLNSAAFLTGRNLYYLLGVLNSKVIEQYIKCTAVDLGESFRVTKSALEIVPVPLPEGDKERAEAIASLAQKAIKSTKESQNIDKIRQEIDEHVFDLYGLESNERNHIKKLAR